MLPDRTSKQLCLRSYDIGTKVSLATGSFYLLTLRDQTLHWTRTPKRIHARKKMSARQAISSCQTTYVPHQRARLLISNSTTPETSVSLGRLRMPHGI